MLSLEWRMEKHVPRNVLWTYFKGSKSRVKVLCLIKRFNQGKAKDWFSVIICRTVRCMSELIKSHLLTNLNFRMLSHGEYYMYNYEYLKVFNLKFVHFSFLLLWWIKRLDLSYNSVALPRRIFCESFVAADGPKLGLNHVRSTLLGETISIQVVEWKRNVRKK